MAIHYLDTTIATGSNDGTSAANAWQSWASLISATVNTITHGDEVRCADDSTASETVSLNMGSDTVNTTDTANPIRFISCDFDNSYTYLAGCTMSSNQDITLADSNAAFYYRGFNIVFDRNGNTGTDVVLILEDCNVTVNASSRLLAVGTNSTVYLNNCTYKAPDRDWETILKPR